MMRLSGSLRRHRRLVICCWLLALIPSVWLALSQSQNLTGGGFEVEGSQSLRVQRDLEDHFPQQGASPLALVAAPRADATYEDMAAAVAQLERAAQEIPSVTLAPTLTQPALMQLGWFARWYPRWKAWKEGVLAEIRQSAVWRAGQRSKRRVKAWLEGLLN